MDRHELNRMFDGLAPTQKRERELLRQLLRDDARRKRPMKNWKRVVIGMAAAALLVTGAAAAVVLPGLNQRFLEYLNVEPENSGAVAEAENLLYPGAMALDITKENNGAALHVTQVLRDRDFVMILADFISPEGTQLYMGEADPPGISTSKGLNNGSGEAVDFLDGAGEPLGKDGLVGFYSWKVLEDDDPMDNHVPLMFTLSPQMSESAAVWNAASLRVPAVNLGYYDLEQQKEITVYSGNWSFEVPLPQKEIGWAMQADQVIGELDGAVMTAGELYLSPMTLELRLSREGGLDFGAPLDEKGEAAYSRWLSIGNDVRRITLITKEGEAIPLELCSGGGGIDFNEKVVVHRLSKITDPAKFQGGTLTIEWDFTRNSEESGSVTIPLEALAPVEP